MQVQVDSELHTNHVLHVHISFQGAYSVRMPALQLSIRESMVDRRSHGIEAAKKALISLGFRTQVRPQLLSHMPHRMLSAQRCAAVTPWHLELEFRASQWWRRAGQLGWPDGGQRPCHHCSIMPALEFGL
jgi:hypothetical protein